jgi:hypothetical protein
LLVDPGTFQTEFGYGFIIQALPKAKSWLEKDNQIPPWFYVLSIAMLTFVKMFPSKPYYN